MNRIKEVFNDINFIIDLVIGEVFPYRNVDQKVILSKEEGYVFINFSKYSKGSLKIPNLGFGDIKTGVYWGAKAYRGEEVRLEGKVYFKGDRRIEGIIISKDKKLERRLAFKCKLNYDNSSTLMAMLSTNLNL